MKVTIQKSELERLLSNHFRQNFDAYDSIYFKYEVKYKENSIYPKKDDEEFDIEIELSSFASEYD